jgi:hypothetical protein
MTNIYELGDSVFHWSYGWGVVVEIKTAGTWSYPVIVEFPDPLYREGSVLGLARLGT